jgi:hypothetical protein
MSKSRLPAQKIRKQAAPRLGPGLHLVHVDLGVELGATGRDERAVSHDGAASGPIPQGPRPRIGNATMVRTLDGRRLTAAIADDVDVGLVDECRRRSRTMIAVDTSRGPTIVGALQTQRTIEHEADGTLVLSGKSVRVVAEQAISIEAGTATSVALESTGKARMTGDRMVIDMSANVRVLSALVQLP